MEIKMGNDRLNEFGVNRNGTIMKIVKYYNSSDIVVEFQDEEKYRTKSTYRLFKIGSIKNPYDRAIYNVGYIGFGKYKVVLYKQTIYKHWMSMLRRCYDPYELNQSSSYRNATVCEEWHNFQNFAKWYEENYYNIPEEKMSLDKDILVKGNKLYSPHTCVFVPERINGIFIKCDKSRGKYPIGVSYVKNSNRYRAKSYTIDHKQLALGSFDNEIDAFIAYKKFKEKTIKEIADIYKDKIPDVLYKALYSYQVEITD